VNSQDILIYGAGLYSFFNNYNTCTYIQPFKYFLANTAIVCLPIDVACSAAGNGETCQTMIFDIEGSCSNVDVYNLNTIGSTSMINRDGQSLARFSDNVNVFPDTIALFRSN
jgi:glucan 1,3-beta-glucosidase